MNINRNTFNELRRHCTAELLLLLQNVDIDESNNGEDIWEVAPYLNNPSEAVNMMKIAFVFEHIGGTLLFNGEPSQYGIIVHGLGAIFNDILLFWHHNEANGVLPIYDTTDVIVPPILPIYAVRECEDGTWGIEKLMHGEYQMMNGEKYLTKREVSERAKELNDE